jgi:hypothetical protein
MTTAQEEFDMQVIGGLEMVTIATLRCSMTKAKLYDSLEASTNFKEWPTMSALHSVSLLFLC